MSIIKMDSEVIAEIKNALTVIQLNAQAGVSRIKVSELMKGIVEQVKRIDRLLPKIKFEGGK